MARNDSERADLTDLQSTIPLEQIEHTPQHDLTTKPDSTAKQFSISWQLIQNYIIQASQNTPTHTKHPRIPETAINQQNEQDLPQTLEDVLQILTLKYEEDLTTLLSSQITAFIQPYKKPFNVDNVDKKLTAEPEAQQVFLQKRHVLAEVQLTDEEFQDIMLPILIDLQAFLKTLPQTEIQESSKALAKIYAFILHLYAQAKLPIIIHINPHNRVEYSISTPKARATITFIDDQLELEHAVYFIHISHYSALLATMAHQLITNKYINPAKNAPIDLSPNTLMQQLINDSKTLLQSINQNLQNTDNTPQELLDYDAEQASNSFHERTKNYILEIATKHLQKLNAQKQTDDNNPVNPETPKISQKTSQQDTPQIQNQQETQHKQEQESQKPQTVITEQTFYIQGLTLDYVLNILDHIPTNIPPFYIHRLLYFYASQLLPHPLQSRITTKYNPDTDKYQILIQLASPDIKLDDLQNPETQVTNNRQKITFQIEFKTLEELQELLETYPFKTLLLILDAETTPYFLKKQEKTQQLLLEILAYIYKIIQFKYHPPIQALVPPNSDIQQLLSRHFEKQEINRILQSISTPQDIKFNSTHITQYLTFLEDIITQILKTLNPTIQPSSYYKDT